MVGGEDPRPGDEGQTWFFLCNLRPGDEGQTWFFFAILDLEVKVRHVFFSILNLHPEFCQWARFGQTWLQAAKPRLKWAKLN